MDVIDNEWIRKRLANRHGEQAKLARAMGIGSDKVTKIMNGLRRVQPHEIPLVLQFFAEPDAARHPTGFSESQVEPLRSDTAADTPPAADRREKYTLKAHLFGFCLLAGDTLLVDLAATPATGDLVIVTLADPESDSAITELRRYTPPLLLGGTPTIAPLHLSEDQSQGILGVVSSVYRPSCRTA